MHFDRAKLDGVQQREEIATDDPWFRPLLHRIQRRDTNRIRHMLTSVLLEEHRSFHAVRISLENKWPAIDLWQQKRCDARVIAHQPALRDAGLRKERFAEAR